MRSWEQAISAALHVVRLDGIKARLLVFGLVATLIPSVTIGWRSYLLGTQLITEKTTEELKSTTSQVARELDLWVRERSYEIRVFSSSYEVTENLETVSRETAGQGRGADARRRLTEYLRSVRGRFLDYEELMVVAPGGQVLASSADQPGTLRLPPDWLSQAQAEAVIVGGPYWDERAGQWDVTLAVSVRAASGRVLGVIAGALTLGSVQKILEGPALGRRGRLYLVDRNGVVIASSGSGGRPTAGPRTASPAALGLLAHEGTASEYRDDGGQPVIGGLKRLASLGWGVVGEIRLEDANARIAGVRNRTLLAVAGVLFLIGSTAYLLGLSIVRPLERLTAGAAQVAAGDLRTDVPAVDHGEVGYLSRVFSEMVTRLRAGREELAAINTALADRNEKLKTLSITDGLTGLYNRKHLMTSLGTEIARARRLKHRCSVLMIDLDHFKRYNDTYGHLEGDRLLSEIASLFRDSVRSIDYAARYGGEEFLLMLYEVGVEGAMQAADRIRRRVTGAKLGSVGGEDPVTVSIGVAVFPEHGGTPEAIIASADLALYEAKGRGRNRVVLAGGEDERPGPAGLDP